MKILSALVISAALMTAPAMAMDTKSAKDTDTAAAATHYDKAAFVKAVGGASAFEIESSKLALQKSTSADVKKFAQMMIDDHTKAGKKLTAILKKEGDPAPDMTLPPKQADAMKQLAASSGTEFDTDYVKLQIDAHKEAVALFKSYASKPDDKKVGQFAKKTLPRLEKHLQHAQMLAAK